MASFADGTTTGAMQVASNESIYLADDPFNVDMLSATNWLDALADGCSTFNFNTGLSEDPQLGTFLAQDSSLETGETPSSIGGTTVNSHSTGSDRRESCATYVSGQSSRPPHVRRNRPAALVLSPYHQESISGFSLTWRPAEALEPCPVEIPSEIYEQMVVAFHRLCMTGYNDSVNFVSSDPPAKELLQQLIHLYWTSFHPVMPLLHPVLNQPEGSKCLTLAMCAIGCHYTEAPSQFVRSMYEWTRRALVEASSYRQERQYLIQARLLYYICSTYNSVSAHTAGSMGKDVLRDIFTQGKTDFSNMRGSDNPNSSWETWTQHEQSKRLAYSAWLLDAMRATHDQVKPALALEDADFPLPCDDELWESQTSAEWQALLATKLPPPTLQESLQQLYISKRLPRNRGEFARILMIHGMYHRLWDVSRYYANPLSSWEPTGKQEEFNLRDPIWLPSVPAFSKWQNSTCDALDILHWQANATIGQKSGYEHPTVLHLHFARVALLVPCEHVLTMAKHRTGLYGIDQAKSEEATQQVQRWAIQHQYKARLAAIHAGVLFWHVRHHSADAFYEAPVVALAALTLWAFGTFARGHSHAGEQQWSAAPLSIPSGQISIPTTDPSTRDQGGHNSTDEDGLCDIILLDRPTDDELVQQFIRHGNRMQAHITGVGDLYAPEGPVRALRKGHKLLTELKYWGVCSEWVALLERLIAVSENVDSLMIR